MQDFKLILRNCISYVLNEIGAEEVILVGFSMGGVTSRAYLSLFPFDHRVGRLITIGSPHSGSKLAYLSKLKTFVLNLQNDHPILGTLFSPLTDPFLEEAKALILDLLQANFFQGAGQTVLSGGDGIVSTASQNLNNLDQFKKDPEFNAEVFYADDVHHLKECWKHRHIKTILEI